MFQYAYSWIVCIYIYDHLWLFDSDYLLAFNKNNIFHKETLKIS